MYTFQQLSYQSSLHIIFVQLILVFVHCCSTESFFLSSSGVCHTDGNPSPSVGFLVSHWHMMMDPQLFSLY